RLRLANDAVEARAAGRSAKIVKGNDPANAACSGFIPDPRKRAGRAQFNVHPGGVREELQKQSAALTQRELIFSAFPWMARRYNEGMPQFSDHVFYFI